MRLLTYLLSVAVAVGQPIGEVVGWKFNHAPGIETRGDKFTRWPATLGPPPTEDQIAVWRVEYSQAMQAKAAEEEIDLDPRETARALEELFAVLIEERAIPRDRVPPPILDRINRRRKLRGLEPL